MFDGGGGSFPGSSAIEDRNAFLEKMHGIDVAALPPAEVAAGIRMLFSTRDLVDLEAARWVAAFDERLGYLEDGEHSTVDWLKAEAHVSSASADNTLNVARQLRVLEPTVEAVEQGGISFEHAVQIARVVGDLPDADAEPAQAELLGAAVKTDPRALRRVGTAIRHRDDPDGFARQAYQQHLKRRLRVYEHADGMVGFEGALPAPEGMKFRKCIESLMGTPRRGDDRTQEQRQADALITLCSEAFASGRLPNRGGRRAQLLVVVQSVAGVETSAELEGVGPISLATVERLRGQDHVEVRQILDKKGVTLRYGRRRRTHSEPQREVIAIDFPTCVGPGCDFPVRDCEVHHMDPWRRNGETDVQLGVPLCRQKHHPQVTEGGWDLVQKPDGTFNLIAPPGGTFTPDQWHAAARKHKRQKTQK